MRLAEHVFSPWSSPWSLPWPVLASAALMLMGSAASVRAVEGPGQLEARFAAVKGLVDHDCRLPAERTYADFTAEHLTGAQWYEKGLAYYIAERFRATLPVDQAAVYERRYRELKAELDAADRAGSLPPSVHALLPGSDATAGLANALLRTLNPYSPPPLAPLSASDRQVASVIAARLCERALADISAARDRALACVIVESPPARAEASRREAAMARGAAVEILYRAWLALGELAWRGPEFGLDPDPARAFLAEAMRRHGAEMAEWDYQFDDYLPMHVQANVLFLEAARLPRLPQLSQQKAGPLSRAEVEEALAQVAGMKPGSIGATGEPGMRDEQARLQLAAWACLLRAGLDHDVAHGIEVWRALEQRERSDPALRLDGPLAKPLGYAHLLGAQLLRSNGDLPEAVAVMSALANAKPPHPLAANAREWVRAWTVTHGEVPATLDPGQALELSRAFLARIASCDANEARAARATAILVLSAGIKGLEPETGKPFIELAPRLWLAYAEAIDRQETRLRATVAATEGAVACAARITAKDNPYRNTDGAWTAGGEALRQLAKTAVAFSAGVYAADRVPAMRRLYERALTAQQAICPLDAGQEQRRGSVIVHLDAGEWDAAAAAAHDLANRDPEQVGWAADAELEARRRSLEDLRGRPGEQGPDFARCASELEALAQARLDAGLAAKQPSAATIEGAIAALWSSARGRQRTGAVLGRMDDRLWSALSGDDAPAQRARVHALVIASEAAAERAAGAADSDWPALAATAGLFVVRSSGLPEQPLRNARTRLASACKPFLASTSDALRGDAQRMFCQLMEPLLSPASGAPLIAATASMLWDQGERLRAARLYRDLDQALGEDRLFAAYRRDPAAAIEVIGEHLASRPETKADWVMARDLLVDSQALADAVRQGVERVQWPERPVDPAQARARLSTIAATVSRLRTVIGEERHAAMLEAITDAQRLSRLIDMAEDSEARQARQLLDAGDFANGIARANRLYQRQPWVPGHAALYVDGVIHGARQGFVADEDLRRARMLAATIRDQSRDEIRDDPAMYWTAYIQVLELSRALRDGGVIERAVRFAAVTGAGPWDDLAAPAVTGDAAGVRRLGDPTAIDLCARYLAICADVAGAVTRDLRRVVVDRGAQVLVVAVGTPALTAQADAAAPGGAVIIIGPASGAASGAASGVSPAAAP